MTGQPSMLGAREAKFTYESETVGSQTSGGGAVPVTLICPDGRTFENVRWVYTSYPLKGGCVTNQTRGKFVFTGDLVTLDPTAQAEARWKANFGGNLG